MPYVQGPDGRMIYVPAQGNLTYHEIPPDLRVLNQAAPVIHQAPLRRDSAHYAPVYQSPAVQQGMVGSYMQNFNSPRVVNQPNSPRSYPSLNQMQKPNSPRAAHREEEKVEQRIDQKLIHPINNRGQSPRSHQEQFINKVEHLKHREQPNSPVYFKPVDVQAIPRVASPRREQAPSPSFMLPPNSPAVLFNPIELAVVQRAASPKGNHVISPEPSRSAVSPKMEQKIVATSVVKEDTNENIRKFFQSHPNHTICYDQNNKNCNVLAVKSDGDIYRIDPSIQKSIKPGLMLVKATHIDTQEEVACKIIPIIMMHSEPDMTKRHCREVEGLKFFKRFKGELIDENYCITLQTWVGDKNLGCFRLLTNGHAPFKAQPLCSDKLMVDYLIQFMKGLRDIHFAGFVHTDVKPDNAVLDSKTGIVTFVDFENMHKIDDHGDGEYFINCPFGTPGYVDPCLSIRGARYSINSDLYGLAKSIKDISSQNSFYSKISGLIENILNKRTQDIRVTINEVSHCLKEIKKYLDATSSSNRAVSPLLDVKQEQFKKDLEQQKRDDAHRLKEIQVASPRNLASPRNGGEIRGIYHKL